MKWIVFVIAVFALKNVSAQIDTTAPCWKQQRIPAFTLLKTDSTFFTEKNLKPNTKTIFMLFSPDCEHCQEQTALMLKNSKLLKNCQVIMATTLPMSYIREFIVKYRMEQYPNFTVLQDNQFFFGPFFKLQQVPMLAFYGNDGKIKMLYNNGATVKQMKYALALK